MGCLAERPCRAGLEIAAALSMAERQGISVTYNDKDHQMGLFCDPGRVRPRGALTGLTIALTSALAVLIAGCARSAAPATASTPSTASSAVAAPHTSSPAGAIHFPATLFGFHHDTGAQAQKVDREVAQMFAMMGMFTHPHVALYGSLATGDMFVVGVSGLTAAAKKYGQEPSAASIHRAFLIQGSQDGRSFPAGTPGAVLGCGHIARSGVSGILCIRYDKKIIGVVTYFNGSASSLRDAASKTSQAISAIGG